MGLVRRRYRSVPRGKSLELWSYGDVLDAYFRWAACFDTPSMAPISDQLRWACRAERTAAVISSSTSLRCSTNSASARNASVSTTFSSAGSTPASPFLKGLGALGPCLAHSVHQPFKNLRRAVMA